jgi:membrane-bound serine protease (ClpP class)
VKLITALAVCIPFAGISMFLMAIALKARRNKVVTGEQGMIGMVGTATTALTPSGKVFVNGELWNAISSQQIVLGEKVVVKAIHGLQLQVEAVTAKSAPPDRISTPLAKST